MKKKTIPVLIVLALVAAGGIGFYAGQQSQTTQPDQAEQPPQAEVQQITSESDKKQNTESLNQAIEKVDVTLEMRNEAYENIYNQFKDRDDLGDEKIFFELCEVDNLYTGWGYIGDEVYNQRLDYQDWREEYHPETENILDDIDDEVEKATSVKNTETSSNGSTNTQKDSKPQSNTGNTSQNQTAGNNTNSTPVVDPELSGFVRTGDEINTSYVDASNGSTISYDDYDPNWRIS